MSASKFIKTLRRTEMIPRSDSHSHVETMEQKHIQTNSKTDGLKTYVAFQGWPVESAEDCHRLRHF